MNTELEDKLLALSLTEKIEVYMYLMPFVTPDFNETEVSPELIMELERRVREDQANPEKAISFEDFKNHWSRRTRS